MFATKLFLIILAANACAYADDNSKFPVLRDLIQEALEKNPGIQAAKHEAVSMESDIGPAGSYDDPQVMLEAQNFPSDTLNAREYGMTGTSLTLSQMIPFPGKLTKRRNAIRHEYEAKSRSFDGKQLEIIRKVKTAYFQLFLAQRRHEITTEQRNLVRQLVVVTRNNYTLGKAPQAELLNMQLEEANLVSELLTSEREVKEVLAELNALLGRESADAIGKVSEPEVTNVDMSRITKEAMLERALKRNPGLQAASAEVSAAEARHSYAKWNFLPDFEVRAGYMFRQPSLMDRGVDFVSAGIGLSVPLWAFTKQSGELRSAGAGRARAEAMLDEKRLELAAMVSRLHSQLLESHGKIELYRGGLLPLAKQSIVSGKAAYLAGKLEYISLLNLINTRFKTELEYHAAIARHESTLAEIEEVIGDSIGVVYAKN